MPLCSPVCSYPPSTFFNQERSTEMRFKKTALALSFAAVSAGCLLAQDKDRDVPRLDHAFVILMENHHYSQIIRNANAPFINSYAKSANLATDYFPVGHPHLTNYL